MQYLLFTTRKGIVKKTKIDEYSQIRPSGLVAINLDEDDRLLSTHITSGKDEVLMVTASGKVIRFGEKDVRATGRATKGVKGVSLRDNDKVIGADTISTSDKEIGTTLLTITENGYGKATPLAKYKQQRRGGQGIFTHKVGDKTGTVVDMMIVGNERHSGAQAIESQPEEIDLLVVSTQGQTIRLPLTDIPSMGRHTQGVRIIKLNKNDQVAALATL